MRIEQIREELQAREPLFHRPELGFEFSAMITLDFWEVGASGRCYSREYVLQELERRQREPQPDVWETRDFCCRELAPGLYLFTYLLLQDHTRWSRRTTLWRFDTKLGWRAEYHQGTLIQEPSAIGQDRLASC